MTSRAHTRKFLTDSILSRSCRHRQRRTATSSDTKVAATVNSDAAIGQFTFTVDQTAAAHAAYTADTVAADDIVSDTGTYAGMTATEASHCNQQRRHTRYHRSTIQTAPGEYRIQLSQQNTGSDSSVGVDASGVRSTHLRSPLSPPVETPKSACPAITARHHIKYQHVR